VNHWSILLSAIASAVLIGGTVVSLIKWGHNQIVSSVKDELFVVNKEMAPNGGSSMRDAVDRIETELFRQGQELDTVTKALERHLGWHEGQSDKK